MNILKYIENYKKLIINRLQIKIMNNPIVNKKQILLLFSEKYILIKGLRMFLN